MLKHSAVPHRNVVCLSQLQILIKIEKLYVRYKREYSIINDVRISIDNEIAAWDYI